MDQKFGRFLICRRRRPYEGSGGTSTRASSDSKELQQIKKTFDVYFSLEFDGSKPLSVHTAESLQE